MNVQKRLYQGRVFSLHRGKSVLPDGRVVDLEYVRHPGAVVMIPQPDKDRVIVLRQYRPVLAKWLCELPAGTKESSETALSCARRELMEEAGVSAGGWKRLGFFYPVPGYSTEKIDVFRAWNLTPASRPKDDEELLRPVEMTRSQIVRSFKSGKIIDAKTIVAFSLLGWL